MTTDSKASDVEAREREAFERWAVDHFETGCICSVEWSERYGEFTNPEVQASWIAWLARASQQPSAQWQFQCKACALLFSANENVGGTLSCPRCLCSTALPRSPGTARN